MHLQNLQIHKEIIRYLDKNLQTYVFGNGSIYVLALPSFPHSGIYFWWLFSHQNLDKYKIISFDLPGWIGESDDYKKDEKYSIEDSVELAKTVINHYTNGPVNIFGYSFGAPIALKIAADWPKRILRLVFVSPVIHGNKLG
ncbi:hypothetical protein A2715_03445 [Candidatus Woesebacteria bacterium RIFCSPHIGHO2_01_FULL_39_32]|uniref:AB hydrolase-1 domain-containing protein n=1 Tax=Candidatus Woesebacteria bacterium RIFCSPLOWO2_01_FULL_39_25 TaxID=1802521 RepID=A0A1F8BKY4_9BACT|nr:MAG: hypothetical protein A2124_00450 [Candidatus Woesebacteria bacterium GWB1_37_5]OGM24794.1 MAG: hypothetical protein A2715_03445 [Candidatus Woesebacteria bacterium RIFCSPHIGHO2_01_FULL_39_32]OGM37115.1 MAG: hypothetical protein A3F01_05385 [Candidatus Woesebacteria bacterium RIFCSPHIGHO2_12_FULL_38_11]OGM64620.1 MAG: hypothetical protein A2893_06360 [Candidatus Woesebacteria bacterium RIFCSPLOWO2_01_FULL_39_25]